MIANILNAKFGFVPEPAMLVKTKKDNPGRSLLVNNGRDD
jgi:hypothetical protein